MSTVPTGPTATPTGGAIGRKYRAFTTLLDLDTVTTALYVAPFDPAELTALPVVRLREWVDRFVADPRSDITRLTAGLCAARDRDAGWLDENRLWACQATAATLFRYRRTSTRPTADRRGAYAAPGEGDSR